MTEEQEAAIHEAARIWSDARAAAEVFPILNRPADPEKRRQLHEDRAVAEAREREAFNNLRRLQGLLP